MKNYTNFIWNRLYRNERVCSKDLEKMFNISNVHASRVIKEFENNFKEKVYKRGRFIFLHPQEKIPDSIVANSLIEKISHVSNQSIYSGLFDDEFPIVGSNITLSKRIDGFLLKILKAIKKNQCIDVVYVSLTKKKFPNEKDLPRVLFPISFKFFDGSCYLIAVDMNKEQNEIIKLFSLSRFKYVELSESKKRPKNINDKKKIRFIVTFNSAFTEDQKNIIIDELGLKIYNNNQYCVDVFEYEKFSFKRKYLSEEKPSIDSNSIYPFFTQYTEQSI